MRQRLTRTIGAIVHVTFPKATILRRTCDAPATALRRKLGVCATRRQRPGMKTKREDLGDVLAVRATQRQPAGMKTTGEDLGDVLGEIACSEERSPLFWWLLEHHAEIAEIAKGRRMRWEPLLRRVLARGLTDGSAKSPTAETVRKTWWKVRREVARAKELEIVKAQLAAAKVQPSRLPATWKPTPVEATPARATSRPASPTNTDSAPTAPIKMSEAGRATLAALDRQLDWRDRYVIPPKRKD